MYIWEKYRTFEITSGIILKMNWPLYKGFTLEITNKWWPLTTLNRWPLYQIKMYSKKHRESTKVTIVSRWPLYKGDRYDRFDCMSKTKNRHQCNTKKFLIPTLSSKNRCYMSILCTLLKPKNTSLMNLSVLIWRLWFWVLVRSIHSCGTVALYVCFFFKDMANHLIYGPAYLEKNQKDHKELRFAASQYKDH